MSNKQMTVIQLIEALEEYREEHGDAIVRIAHQPNWPLAHDLVDVVNNHDFDEEIDEDDDGNELDHPEYKSNEFGNTIWLVASAGNCREHPYAPRELFDLEYR